MLFLNPFAGHATGFEACSEEALIQDLPEAHALMLHAEYLRSERIFTTILACQEQLLPSNHLNIAVTLANLGELKRLQRNYPEAERLVRRALSAHEAAGRTDRIAYGGALLILASVYKDRMQYYRAEPLVRQALTIFEHSLGPQSREAAAAVNTLAVLRAELGDLSGAERDFRSAIDRRKDSPPDPSTATADYNLRRILIQLGSSAEAEVRLREALALRVRLLGSWHPDTRVTLDTYVALLKSSGRKSEARDLMIQTLRSR